MRLNDLIKRLKNLQAKEFIQTLRNGPTGIGHLAESELGLDETNIAIPDIGGRVEVKTTRRNVNSLITLFTFNKAVWKKLDTGSLKIQRFRIRCLSGGDQNIIAFYLPAAVFSFKGTDFLRTVSVYFR